MMAEFKHRFTEENVKLWSSMEALHPKSKQFLDSSLLQPLYDDASTIPNVSKVLLEIGADIEVLRAQCKVHKNVVEENLEDGDPVDVLDVFRVLKRNYPSTAYILVILYHVAITYGYASTRVECLFQLLHVTPKRMCQSPYRECNLTHIYVEKYVVNKLTFEEFAQEWNKKARKLNF